jgi:signal transduction histidine kinase
VPIPQLAIAVGTIAARLPRRTAFPAALAGLAVLVVPTLYSKGWSGSAAVSGAIFLAAAWLFGDSLRSRRAYISEIEDRAERLQREQVAQRERAAAEEKARIARELHDVVAHSVSVILVQADAADDVFDKAPERAHEAVRAIAETARTALEDLRRVLGALHQEPDFQPQPRLATIDQLAEKVRTTGLVVDVAVEGDPRPLPAAVDLSAYRIIQEALTNTVRHAEARRVAVKVRYDEELVLEVCDDGIGSANGKNVGGRGLIGMRERVALLGGQIAIGPRPTGGFSVSARIPIGLPQ